MWLPQITNSLENTSNNSSDVLYLSSDSSYSQSDNYSSSSCYFIPKITMNRKVNTCHVSHSVKLKQESDNRQVSFSNLQPDQNSVTPLLSSGSPNSSSSSDSFSSPTLFLKNANHFLDPKILMNSQVTARYITDTELQVNIELKANTNRAASTDKSTDTNKAEFFKESRVTKEVVKLNQAGDASQVKVTDQAKKNSKQNANSGRTLISVDEKIKQTEDIGIGYSTTNLSRLPLKLSKGSLTNDWELDADKISLSSSDSQILAEMRTTDDWGSVSCCSNYSGASNTTYSINTELLSASDFPSSD